MEYLDRAAPSGIRVRHTVCAAIEAETKVCPNPEHTLNHNSLLRPVLEGKLHIRQLARVIIFKS